MKRSLRKTTAGVSVMYSDGDYSHNLTGTAFILEASQSSMCFSIDSSGNLRVRNRAANCYDDACALAEKHSKLESIQIAERQVVDGLAAAYAKAPGARWEVELLLGVKGSFKYPAKLRRSNGSILLKLGSDG